MAALPHSEPPTLSLQPPKEALWIIFLIVLTDFFGFGIIIPLLPFYVHDYQQNPLKVTLLFSVYSICQFIASPILGAISDRHGRRPVLVISQVGSAVGYVLLGVSTQLHFLSLGSVLLLVYLSRIIDGISGGNISTAQAYISDVTTPANRAKGMGLLGAAFGIGFSAGPAIGGLLGARNPSIPAYVAAAFSGAAALLTYLRLPESRVHKPAPDEAWLHPSRFKPLLAKPILVQLLVISFITMAAFVMMECTIGLYLNRLFGYEQKQVGYFFAFVGVVIVIVQGKLIGPLTQWAGEWQLAVVGPLLVTLGMIGFFGLSVWALVPLLALSGAVNATGRSLHQPTISSLISKYADPREQGIVFGMFQGLGSLARVFGPLCAGFIYTRHPTGPYLVAGGLTCMAALWTLGLRLAAGNPAAAPAQLPVMPTMAE